MASSNEIAIPEEFQDIAPVSDSEFKEKMAYLLQVPEFQSVVKFVMPDIDFDTYSKLLLNIESKDDFQHKVMVPILNMLEAKTTTGVRSKGLAKLNDNQRFTFVTNHRDIVLDACFLNLNLFRGGHNTSEVAIGDNLLIYEWIDILVRLNKSFIVKRNLPVRQALEAAMQLSGYIHFAVNDKKQSVWIAQREGRAKDSNDRTQESLLKMLALGGSGNIVEKFLDLNICPVALCYEYDPNDYLKAKEFLLKKKYPDFKKSKQDDLISMQTGILGYKGNIVMCFANPINDAISQIADKNNKQQTYKDICAIIDKEIHSNYEIFPNNYIAYDILNATDRFADKYSDVQKTEFIGYLNKQLSKVDIEDLIDEDKDYMFNMMLKMYANPLVNKLEIAGLP